TSDPHSVPTRRSADLGSTKAPARSSEAPAKPEEERARSRIARPKAPLIQVPGRMRIIGTTSSTTTRGTDVMTNAWGYEDRKVLRSEEHTSELQSRENL